MERSSLRTVDDKALSRRLQRKDHRLVDDVFDAYGSALYGIIYRIVNHEQRAEKVLHDTFRIIWQRADLYNPKRMTFFTWIMMVARRLAQEQSDCDQSIPMDGSDRMVSESMTDEQKESVRALFTTLSPGERIVAQSVIFDGCSHAETARRLDTSIDTIRNQLRTILLTLRSELPPLP